MIEFVESSDGSFTAYSEEFKEHYHSTLDGALNESLRKHVKPAMKIFAAQEKLLILDICFGLGFNTLATLYYLKLHGIKKQIKILSPELDKELVTSLVDFAYPVEFDPFKEVISSIAHGGRYVGEGVDIEVDFVDAREFLQDSTDSFDIVYHDAFSPKSNPALWSIECFGEIERLTDNNTIITTYSTALKTRLALYRNGFNIYLNSGKGYRDATIASKRELCVYKKVDMEHKIACNKGVLPLSD